MGKSETWRAMTCAHGGVVVTEGATTEVLEQRADYVAFAAAGEARVGEYHCSECGYGVIVQRLLPLCPMCGGTSWEPSPRRPYGL